DPRYAVTGELADAIERLRGVSPAWIGDAQATTNVMDPGINPVWDGAAVVGPAFTARCYANSIITVHKALLEAPPGSVIVVDGAGDYTGALFGEMMATQARANGVAGLVADGAVRDRDALRGLGFPVFARAVTPRVGSNRRVGTTQEDVVCGGVVVRPGDLIVGGADGVAVIPRARLAQVLGAVDAVAKKEAEMRARMQRGEVLADILGMRALIYPR
ncbi:MAG TPA: RraA family protein, partial [bacterium]|nr:RraA family protein [bacterium]